MMTGREFEAMKTRREQYWNCVQLCAQYEAQLAMRLKQRVPHHQLVELGETYRKMHTYLADFEQQENVSW